MALAASAPSVVFYISGHGFGHASRQVEVINTLGQHRPDIPIVLRTAVPPPLLARTLRAPVTRLDGVCDTGVVQRDSVTHDDAATMAQAVAFHQAMPSHVAAEEARLAPFRPGLIVGDIPPLAFEVAARLGCPSLAIGNFTWDWIYEWYADLHPDTPALLSQIRHGYRLATHALELPLSGGFDVFPSVAPLPFIARHAEHSREDVRHRLGLEAHDKVALLSFGGYGLDRLDVSRLDCLTDWTVLLTDRTTTRHATAPDRVRFLPETLFDADLRYEDVVGAVDVVVTKPGYGIISECVAHDTAMLYTSRGRFREYDVMVRDMPSFLRCAYLPHENLFGGRWRDALETLLAQPAPRTRVATDGARQATDAILRMYDAGTGPASRSAADSPSRTTPA